MKTKRVLSIQDISCIGSCSLTVALPILSASGLETAILPTAVLSTHTGFKGFTFRDLTDDFQPIADHWKQEKFTFDGIYTGYLGSPRQIELVEKIFTGFRHPEMVRFVDPVLGDNGKLYPGFTPEFAKRMSGLCAYADIIVPNLTEAAFMLGEPYPGNDCPESKLRPMLRRLCGLGCRTAVLTGVLPDPDHCGAVAYDSLTDQYYTCYTKHLPAAFHGTGDIFASACFAAIVRGKTLEEALRIAVEYSFECIRVTLADPAHHWYGTEFESAIPLLLKLLGIPQR